MCIDFSAALSVSQILSCDKGKLTLNVTCLNQSRNQTDLKHPLMIL